jgi:hypothetical protein
MFTFKCKRGDIEFVYAGVHYGRAFDHINVTTIPVREGAESESLILPLANSDKPFDSVTILNAQGYKVDTVLAPKPANQNAPLSPDETERLAKAALGEPATRRQRRAAAKAD